MDHSEVLQPIIDFLDQLLEIVGHESQEREQAAALILSMISELAIATLVAALAETDRPAFLDKLKKVAAPTEIWKLITAEFSPDEVQSALTFASQDTLSFYLQQVTPHLSPDQLQKLDQLMQSTRNILKDSHAA